jgi:hypothetical protein
MRRSSRETAPGLQGHCHERKAMTLVTGGGNVTRDLMDLEHLSHQEIAVYFSCLFHFLESKKSSDTRKYYLLIKRNPLYFLGHFSSFGEIGVAFDKSTLLWKS